MSQSSTSIQSGTDEPAPLIPKKLFIGTLSGLAFATGLTIALIPAFKRNRQRTSTTLKKGLDLGTQPVRPKTFSSKKVLLPEHPSSISPNSARKPTLGPLSGLDHPQPVTVKAPAGSVTQQALPVTSQEEQILTPSDPSISYFSLQPASPYSEEEDSHGFPLEPNDPDGVRSGELQEGQEAEGNADPFFAIKAFGIATGLVMGTAGLGVYIIGKTLGVDDMTQFTQKMRLLTTQKLPTLTNSIYSPLPSSSHSPSSSSSTESEHPAPLRETEARRTEREEEERIVKGWWSEVVDGAEEERRAVLGER